MQWVMDCCYWVVQVLLRPEQAKEFVLLKKPEYHFGAVLGLFCGLFDPFFIDITDRPSGWA